MDTGFNALVPSVRKPGVDGIITRYEVFDVRPL
jgi:putative heme degradation protein